MNALDVGVAFNVPSLISLEGATVTVILRDPNGMVKAPLSMTVGTTTLEDDKGNTVAQASFWAYRDTLITDFPISGQWSAQLIADWGDGTTNVAGDLITVNVGVRLKPPA